MRRLRDDLSMAASLHTRKDCGEPTGKPTAYLHVAECNSEIVAGLPLVAEFKADFEASEGSI